jgi:integrase/recombinase XerD
MTALAPTLQAYFTTRLVAESAVSAHTVAAYRDTWRLLLRFLTATTRTPPQDLDLADLDAEHISAFLTDLEVVRGNAVTTRNARLAAVHSFFTYAAYRHPEHAATISRVLSIPTKRHPRTDVTYLSATEVTALLDAPARTTPAGRRDHALIQVAVTTGLRVSELTGLQTTDLHLGAGAHLTCRGKGRKTRSTPLDRQTVAVLRAFIPALPAGDGYVFPTRTGTKMSTDAVAARLARHAQTAAVTCPSLTGKNITPHVLRHTAVISPAPDPVRDVGFGGGRPRASRVSATCRYRQLRSPRERVDQLCVPGRAGGVFPRWQRVLGGARP